MYFAASMPGIGGETFQIATDRETTIQEVINTLLAILLEVGYSTIQVQYVAPWQGDVRRKFSDTSKAGKMLAWKVEIELVEGLRRTVE